MLRLNGCRCNGPGESEESKRIRRKIRRRKHCRPFGGGRSGGCWFGSRNRYSRRSNFCWSVDFVFNISESDIVLVKETKPGIESKDLEKLARSIVDTLGSESYTKVVVGIGTSIVGVKDLARSFKEAQVALEVGKVFDTEKSIVSYDNLGIARLIYQLPTTLCDMFLREVFKKGSIESLDHETLFTIQKFFENNLNVSETSRKLFVHRNTLVYRLEKIKKLTGLDLREFDHAIIFKVALMVKKYLTSNPIKY